MPPVWLRRVVSRLMLTLRPVLPPPLLPRSGQFSPTSKKGRFALTGKRKLKKKWLVSMIPQFAPLTENDRKKIASTSAALHPDMVRCKCYMLAVCGGLRGEGAVRMAHVPNLFSGSPAAVGCGPVWGWCECSECACD